MLDYASAGEIDLFQVGAAKFKSLNNYQWFLVVVNLLNYSRMLQYCNCMALVCLLIY